VLYQAVRDHFETFRAQAAGLRNGEGPPRFVEQEFRDVPRCGALAAGFARFRCAACGFDRLVPFSCKARACCPSCGGRRIVPRVRRLLERRGLVEGDEGAGALDGWERLAVLIPRPRINLILYHGVLGPRGGRLRLIALIDEASVIERILRHLRLPAEVPTPRPGRAPPPFAARSFDEDTGVSAFDPCA
jgi:hypothetical protein